jgi:hypothetical protein
MMGERRIDPARLAADTGYGSAEMLDWLVNEEGIEPHVPVFDKSQRTDLGRLIGYDRLQTLRLAST